MELLTSQLDDDDDENDNNATGTAGRATTAEADALMVSSTTHRRRPRFRWTIFVSTLAVVVWLLAVMSSSWSMSGQDHDSPSATMTPNQSSSTIPMPRPATIHSNNNTSTIHRMACQTDHPDRLGHNRALYAGQAICNEEYQFGITLDGALAWKNYSSTSPVIVLHQDSAATWFRMTDTATFQLLDGDDTAEGDSSSSSATVLWEAAPNRDVHFTSQCLSRPVLDCPYLHLHKSGDIVLNYINEHTGWNARNVRRSFPDLF